VSFNSNFLNVYILYSGRERSAFAHIDWQPSDHRGRISTSLAADCPGGNNSDYSGGRLKRRKVATRWVGTRRDVRNEIDFGRATACSLAEQRIDSSLLTQ